jgi:hypothetical protein
MSRQSIHNENYWYRLEMSGQELSRNFFVPCENLFKSGKRVASHVKVW